MVGLYLILLCNQINKPKSYPICSGRNPKFFPNNIRTSLALPPSKTGLDNTLTKNLMNKKSAKTTVLKKTTTITSALSVRKMDSLSAVTIAKKHFILLAFLRKTSKSKSNGLVSFAITK